jgi:predicted DNA-binding protein (MmcQ/YjbR family)
LPGPTRIILSATIQPLNALYWRSAFESVIPGYHMNKVHWSSVILDRTVPDDAVKDMIAESFDLTKPKIRKRKIMPDSDKDWDDA